jgi:hypothetical protein
MARYDKYDPVSGGFRAPLADSYTGSETPIGVGLDVNGRVVPGAGETGVVGVLIKTLDAAAGDIVDVMTAGEIVEFDGAAGTNYFAASGNGAVSTTATGTNVGHTVEESRLVVRVVAGTDTA